MRAWARAEMGRHDWRQVLEAGVAMSNYNAKWVGEIDVPTAVLVTTQDRAVNPFAQLRMALKIPGAQIHRIDDGHIVCAKPSFGPAVAGACADVASRLALR
jgi:pimeloyl-ACP methyl ester carboxylesterase